MARISYDNIFGLVIVIAVLVLSGLAFQLRPYSSRKPSKIGNFVARHATPMQEGAELGRESFLKGLGIGLLTVTMAPRVSSAKSYSANARNLERMNSGDMSGGSLYDNNPKSEAGKKRRAMVGCKNSVAREEAAENALKVSALSEKDCNQMVLAGDTEFMLQALRTLDCPTCPYGISGKR